MSAVTSIGAGLQAAFMLARGRPDGLARMAADPSPEMVAARRSFWAILLCLPALICLHILDWVDTGIPADPARGFAAALLSYVIGWVGFALLSHRIAGQLERAANWPRFIAIWNWCNVVQYVMLLAASVPSLLGVPAVVGETTWLVGMGWALWLEWYATKLALGVGGFTAVGLVGVDFSIGLFLTGLIGN
jgi:hypothetical protein